jgi:hypothetical protein
MVECAVRADGRTSPVAEFLDRLQEGSWQPENDDDPGLEPDEQVDFRNWFLAEVKHFANTGEMRHGGAYNQLVDGIWEFKHSNVRVSFYDHDDHGNYIPKTAEKIWVGGGGYFRLPEDFDYFIRLGIAFTKSTQKTLKRHLAEAVLIREEDLSHDAPEG